MKKYELKEATREVKVKDRSIIKTGVCMNAEPDVNSAIVKVFTSLEDAMAELKKPKYRPTCEYMPNANSYYLVSEFYIEEWNTDEDGEDIDGGNAYFAYEYEFDEAEGNIDIRKGHDNVQG